MPSHERRRLVVTGTVQGVGFRPWAVRQARRLGLSGTAANDRTGLVLEVEGPSGALDAFVAALRTDPPPLALVANVSVSPMPAVSPRGEGRPHFIVVASRAGDGPAVAVPADVATCAACLDEMRDPAARRFRYPFTNCTDCGPRYTIIRSLPYDRATTTMAEFTMCDTCAHEYADPSDRRFHAEPIACPDCGPSLEADTGERGEEALARAAAGLVAGGILALKGIGGYHLAVLAGDEKAVARLRGRKARDDKPFAVMVSDADAAMALVVLDAEGLAALTSARRPIVVAPRRPEAAVAPGVAPNSADLGVLLAYSPLHHLLLADVGRPLVMTSGNRAHEPMAQHPVDARRQLGDIADEFLHHDRRIEVRCDDSVVRAVGGRTQVVRRSRGYAPEPLVLPGAGRRQILAVGAELKNTVAVAAGGTVVASHHLGDLEHPSAYAAFEQAIAQLLALTGVDPDVVVHDLHPEYLSTKWALDGDRPTIGVQHHHAHVASCLVDNERTGPVLGLAFDGLGFGADGTLWGGEFLAADLREFERVAHLRPVALPGGGAAVREPWRMALAWVALALGDDAAASLGPSLDPRWATVLALTSHPITPHTTSGGRLFDAIAALAGLRNVMTYEGQAAVELEAAARTVVDDDSGTSADGGWVGEGPAGEDGPWILDPSPLVADAFAGRLAGVAPRAIAASFHRRLAAGLSAAAAALARREGLTTVALTGGVFQNSLLTTLVADALGVSGLEVLLHHRVPPNDGGISIGQAAVVAATS